MGAAGGIPSGRALLSLTGGRLFFARGVMSGLFCEAIERDFDAFFTNAKHDKEVVGVAAI